MQRKTKYLIVVSFDALSSKDFNYISNLPNFKSFLENASYCKNVTSIYPTLTYPAHTTIVTGRYPKDHGIVNNTLLQPSRNNPDWYWHRKYVKGETLYDVAIDEGLKVASLLWPVTAKSRIQYNMPEIWKNRRWHNQIVVSLLSGTPLYQYQLNKMFRHLREGISQPQLDNFTHQSLLYTLKTYKPDLTFVHFIDLDTQRHEYGFDSIEATQALERHDKRLGEIINVLKQEKMYEESTLVLLGDHSTLDANKIIYLNSIFEKNGYIEIKDGVIRNWKVIAKSCDGSVYIYIKDKGLRDEVRNLLDYLAKNKENGIEIIYSGEEVRRLGAAPDCDFMLEARYGYYFLDDIKEQLIREIQPSTNGKRSMVATHGYSPNKPEYSTVFMIAGQGIKKNVEIQKMSLLDEASTMATLLGLNLNESQGRVLDEILQ